MLQPECIQQLSRNFLAAASDQDFVSVTAQLRNRLTEKVHVCGVSYIDKYTHPHSPMRACPEHCSLDLQGSLLPIGQIRYLLGDQSNQKNDDCRRKQQHAHVGKAVDSNKRVKIIPQSKNKERKASRHKQFEWGVQRCDLEDDQEEAQPIAQRPDMALANTQRGFNRYICHRVRTAKKCHRAGRRIRKPVWQKM